MRKWRNIILLIIVITLFLSLAGFSVGYKFNVTLVCDGKVILQKDYLVNIFVYVKIYLKHKGDFLSFYNSSDNKINALQTLDKRLYGDINKSLYGYEVPPVSARIDWTSENFDVIRGKEGILTDKIAVFQGIFENFGKRITVDVPLIPIKAGHTEAELKNATKIISSFSTNYSTSKPERKHNIKLAASLINGTVLKPQQTFSFNEIVGKRTEERGFKSATVIEYGKFVSGIGGGVCQVSTTLYNAALLSGLQVEAVKHHTLPVSYVPLSFDAMVSTYNDLKFCNRTDFDIFIVAKATDEKLTFTFYGLNYFGNLTPKLRSITVKKLENVSYEQIIDTNNELLADENERIVTKAKIGYMSEGYLDLYNKNGILVESKRIRKDTYMPQNGKMLIRDKNAAPLPLPDEGAGSDAA